MRRCLFRAQVYEGKGARYLPPALFLTLSLHTNTRTLAHLPSIFRIGKVGQLHVSYASTFVPTHTHTCTHLERT